MSTENEACKRLFLASRVLKKAAEEDPDVQKANADGDDEPAQPRASTAKKPSKK